jgi:hypothetical protein
MVMVVAFADEISTEHLPNTSLERYRYTAMLGSSCVLVIFHALYLLLITIYLLY